MSNFEVELDQPLPAVDLNGWDHNSFRYEITPAGGGMDGYPITGIYRAGLGIDPDSVTGEQVLQCVARDLEMATEAWCSHPNVREIIATFEHDYGYESPTRVYDMAVELVEVVDWYWSLSDGEQQELQDLAEDED